MDPGDTGSYLRYLQDSSGGPAGFSHSSTQPSFMSGAAPFPLFCTQPTPPSFCTQPPPPPPAAEPVPPEAPSSSCRPGRGRRVRVNPDPADDNTRKYYTTEEDLCLVSAWLNNSTDPIEGETYWTKVAETYNSTIPVDWQRDASCLKSHWHNTITKVNLFNGCYSQLRDAYASGRSELQLLDQAMEL